MECTEVKVHTQNIKPREYRVWVQNRVAALHSSQGFGISGSALLTSVLVCSV